MVTSLAVVNYATAVTVATVAGVDLAIDLHSKTPLYLQLAEKLIAAIDAGEIQPRQPIPSLRDLTEQTGIGMSTVQRAIRELERRSYVYSLTGRGVFVTPRNWEPREMSDT